MMREHGQQAAEDSTAEETVPCLAVSEEAKSVLPIPASVDDDTAESQPVGNPLAEQHRAGVSEVERPVHHQHGEDVQRESRGVGRGEGRQHVHGPAKRRQRMNPIRLMAGKTIHDHVNCSHHATRGRAASTPDGFCNYAVLPPCCLGRRGRDCDWGECDLG